MASRRSFWRSPPSIVALAATWPPDLVVRETSEYGGCLAAELLGVPHAAVGINAVGEFVPRQQVAAALDARRAEHGLPPDPAAAMRDRYLTLRPFPPGFRDPALRVARPSPTTCAACSGTRPGRRRHRRGSPRCPTDRSSTSGWAPPSTSPPGSSARSSRGYAMSRSPSSSPWAATRIRPDYGPQPENVHIERYIPLSLLLPHCALAVTAGGSGSLVAALANGLPVVVVPVAADKPANAARCAALGLGRVVPPADLTPETVRQAVLSVLGDPAYRAAAQRMRAEIAALPGPKHAVALLEQLAVEWRGSHCSQDSGESRAA
jgi:Erythromycin biosynthesis protein CIII-like, C-terminal domain